MDSRWWQIFSCHAVEGVSGRRICKWWTQILCSSLSKWNVCRAGDLLSPEVRSQARPVRYGDVVQLCCRHVGYHRDKFHMGVTCAACDRHWHDAMVFSKANIVREALLLSQFVTWKPFFHPNVPGSIYVLGCMLVPGGLYIQRSKLVISMGASPVRWSYTSTNNNSITLPPFMVVIVIKGSLELFKKWSNKASWQFKLI